MSATSSSPSGWPSAATRSPAAPSSPGRPRPGPSGRTGGSVTITDGPYAETAEQLTGFYTVESDDLDDLLEVVGFLAGAEGALEVRACVRPLGRRRMRFLLLMSDDGVWDRVGDQERRAIMQAHVDFAAAANARATIVAGEALAAPTEVLTLRAAADADQRTATEARTQRPPSSWAASTSRGRVAGGGRRSLPHPARESYTLQIRPDRGHRPRGHGSSSLRRLARRVGPPGGPARRAVPPARPGRGRPRRRVRGRRADVVDRRPPTTRAPGC